jgi:NifU-like protein involved in Fe-S cluster formation
VTYSDTFKEHLQNPRNAGELAEATHTAEETNPICGDRLRLSLRVEDGRIVAVRFLAYGCPPTIVCGSQLVQMIEGLNVQEALRVTKQDIVQAIGGLPSRKAHAAALAVETLQSALKTTVQVHTSDAKANIEKQRIADLQMSYDRVAKEYVACIYDELRHKPLDCELLDRFAVSVKDLGLVCDVGCGPGHVTRYLSERGVKICGIDLSFEMIEQAKQLAPDIEFKQGNMMSLDVADESWVGIIAFYSIIHIPRENVVNALIELKRTLRAGGLLFLAFHIGEEILHLDEWWGEKVSVDFIFFRSDEMKNYLVEAGFEVEEIIEREPYPDVEHQSRRAYIFARKPAKCFAVNEAFICTINFYPT